jgi:RimJ/RimL family protein N-acetyltransferase
MTSLTSETPSLESLLALDANAQELLFTAPRNANTFSDEPVSDERLRAITNLAKWPPTMANANPLRILFLRTPEGKNRLAPLMSDGNLSPRAGTVAGPALPGHLATRPALFALASDPEVTRFFSWGPYRHEREAEAWLATLPERRARAIALELAIADRDDRAIGRSASRWLSELNLRDRRAIVGTFLGRRHWGTGANREVKALIAQLAFGPVDLERLAAYRYSAFVNTRLPAAARPASARDGQARDRPSRCSGRSRTTRAPARRGCRIRPTAGTRSRAWSTPRSSTGR